jgi:UrcA family protein
MKTFISNLTSRRLAFAGFVAVAACAVTQTSFASPPLDRAPAVHVRYDDLNLATASGTSALYQRIKNAADKVCPDYASRDLGLVAAGASCRADAIARAVSDMHNSQLAMLHANRVDRG